MGYAVRTGLYNDYVVKMINSLIDDTKLNGHGGYLEPCMYINYTLRAKHMPDGEVVVDAPVGIYCYSKIIHGAKSEKDAAQRFAYTLKRIICDWLATKHNDAKHRNWNRSSNLVVTANYTIKEFYYLYDVLLKHVRVKNYDSDLVNKMTGEAYNPIVTEMNSLRDSKIREIIAKRDKDLNDTDRNFNAMKRAALDKIKNDASAAIEEVKKQFDELIAASEQTAA